MSHQNFDQNGVGQLLPIWGARKGSGEEGGGHSADAGEARQDGRRAGHAGDLRQVDGRGGRQAVVPQPAGEGGGGQHEQPRDGKPPGHLQGHGNQGEEHFLYIARFRTSEAKIENSNIWLKFS